MQRILLSEITPERLAALAEPAIIVGPDGKSVGYYEPQPQPPYDPAILPPPLSEEEVRRRVEQGGRPLADILNDLRKMA